MTRKTADVVVIGAGIMGASCAYHLARRGLDVVVLEREAAPAMESTGKSLAGVRVQFTTESNIRMSWHSIQVYREFEERFGHDVGYQPIGYLLLVPPERWDAHLEAVALQRKIGVPVEVVDLDDAQRWLPFETGGLAGATWGPVDGIVGPHMAALAWVDMGKAEGVDYHLRTPVTGIERRESGWRVHSGGAAFDAGYVVNAAGAWSGQVASLAGLHVPVEPMRNLAFLTAPIEDPRTYPLTIDLGSGFFLRSEGSRVVFGLTNDEEQHGFIEGVDWDWLEPTLLAGVERFPWFEEVGIDRKGSWWGYYEVTPDHNPIIGRHPDAEAWIDACGFSGHGIMHAPATGLLVSEIIADGEAHTLPITAYRHGRFAEGAAAEANIF